MEERRATILGWLEEQGIEYKLVEHPAAYDMADIEAFGVQAHGPVAKNLFLRDSKKGRRHMLVTVLGDARVDLAHLGERLGERLSFASEERLRKYLNLEKGEVTPLGVYFDTENAVEVFFDSRLAGCEMVGVHPADNTATVFMAFDDLAKLVRAAGNTVTMVEL